MSDLKPCPFCGCKELSSGVMAGTMFGWTYVQCTECLAEIHVNSPLIKKAANAWNRRAVNVPDTNVGDTISRQAAVDEIELGITYAKVINIETGEATELFKASNTELRKAIDRIKALPAVQPRRLRGRWVETERRGVLAGAKYYKCDICAQPIVVIDSTPITDGYNYCPRCGSQMEEEQDG